MSLSSLYHGFGLYDCHHLKIRTEGGAIYLNMVRAKNRCYRCGSYKLVHKGYRWRTLRTLPIGRKLVYAVIKMRRFYCRECHRRLYENLRIADKKKHYTHAMERYVMDLCARMTIRDVSEHTGLHGATVKTIERKRPEAVAVSGGR